MTIIEQMMDSPRLPEYVKKLNQVLEEERANREKFYEWLPDDKKAEFINGRVFVHSPVKSEHEDASSNLHALMRAYVIKHKLGRVGHEKLLVTLTRNDYEPDIVFWRSEKSSGFTKDQMQFPAPDLAVEVLSPSTAEHDREIKFEDYAAHGVDAYWIVDPQQQTVEQYLLAGDKYELALKVNSGTIKSRAIRGMELPVRAAFESDANLKALADIVNG